MTADQKKRLCWNCDGTVDQHMSHCTYCGAEMLRHPDDVEPVEEEAAYEEELPEDDDEKTVMGGKLRGKPSSSRHL